MATKRRRSNPLALAVLVLLFERPMHPYEMAVTLRERKKQESIKLRYGSLYTVIELLQKEGQIAPREIVRSGRRPERTVYEMTAAGREEMRGWLSEILRAPAKEYPQFEAGLALLPALPVDEVIALLGERARCLGGMIEHLRGQIKALTEQGLEPLFVVESEYRLAMIEAEWRFVKTLGRRIQEEGWGSVPIWKDLHAAKKKASGSRGG